MGEIKNKIKCLNYFKLIIFTTNVSKIYNSNYTKLIIIITSEKCIILYFKVMESFKKFNSFHSIFVLCVLLHQL